MTDLMKARFLREVKDDYRNNYILVKELDNRVISFIKDRGGNIIRKAHLNELECELDGKIWIVKPLRSNNMRGHKPRGIILDRRLDDDIIEESGILYNMLCCTWGEVF